MQDFQRELRARLHSDSLALSEASVLAKADLDHPSFQALELGQSIDQYAAVLFLDIRGFTRLSMALSLSETARVLNAVVGASAARLRDYGAHINDFPGDGIMAVFAEEDYADPSEVDARTLFGVSHLMAEMSATLRDELLQVGVDDPVQVAIGLYSGVVRWQRVGLEDCNRLMALGEVAPLAAKFATSEITKAWQTMVGGTIAGSIPDEFRTQQEDFERAYNQQKMARARYLLDTSGLFNQMPTLLEAHTVTNSARRSRSAAVAPAAVLPDTLSPSVKRRGTGNRPERGIG